MIFHPNLKQWQQQNSHANNNNTKTPDKPATFFIQSMQNKIIYI